ncbi:helix-turn-helix domain-containing protein [Bacillus sp. FSL W8-0920]|uniref:helix-turn-helix domain-containing protein n=1 Tax=Bacillus TaxID=1386 RepID=UPI001B836AF1|nr:MULTISPECIES: helix-turn-helix domain-containing protein [Bacillus]MBR0590384.1 recombinase RecQ [Bacillus pumilus sxm20-2]MCY7434126.1 helix-turn-helix domain-containing protein [Bacillus pumilus]MDR0121917.1 helix-turn-helix domain-containing protein [Bacillus pumilus]MED1526751.1 helix-turn-helix domain-containing protein [Bacillus pumilus]UDF14964.1 helix-turn-helix domain-containing protein [Bacillus pumilus]
MTLHYLDVMLMDSVYKLNGERSISAVYHLFKGKKSSQTIQDASLFELSRYFGCYPGFTRDQLNRSALKLEEKHYIRKNDETLSITEAGQQMLHQHFSEKPMPAYFHGAKYHDKAKMLWMRLSLLVQVLSHHMAGSHQYVPIQRDVSVQSWTKSFLKQHQQKSKLSEELHHELEKLLMNLSDQEALIFVYSLTSHERIGRTYQQMAEWMKEDVWYVYLLFWNVLHYFIQSAQKGEAPTLQKLVGDLEFKRVLTTSTHKTLELVQKGFDIEQIAHIRSLKKATIEDHIVELSIHEPSFSIDPYVSIKEQREILAVARELQTNKMKLIKEKLEHPFTYFQIRLALTRMVKANG